MCVIILVSTYFVRFPEDQRGSFLLNLYILEFLANTNWLTDWVAAVAFHRTLRAKSSMDASAASHTEARRLGEVLSSTADTPASF